MCCSKCVANQIDYAAAWLKTQVVQLVVGTSNLALFDLKLHPVNYLRNLMHASVLPDMPAWRSGVNVPLLYRPRS